MQTAKRTAEAFVLSGAVLVLHDTCERQSPHAHRPFEFIAALDGCVRLKRATGDVVEARSILIPPMEQHAILSSDGRVARVYLDPGIRRVVSWKGDAPADDTEACQPLLSRISAFFDSSRTSQAAKELVDHWRGLWLETIDRAPILDRRVVTILQHLNDKATQSADRTTVARLVNLSPSRLAAIFANETGMSLRQYIKWRRILVAARLIKEGETITMAAMRAGFADNAHLTRSYRAAFGYPPSRLIEMKVAPPICRRHGC